MCRCGHELGFHDPCSKCECPRFEGLQTRGAARSKDSNRKTYPKRPTK